MRIAFRPLTPEDEQLLDEWLRRDHVQRWWRDEKAADHVYDDEPGEHYIMLVDGRPVGMIQTYLVSDYPDWDAVVEMGEGVAGVDLLVGEAELVGRGVGPRVLDAFVREVVFARPETDAVCATVEEENRRSWRAFEKAGFAHVRDVEEDGLPHRLMRRDR
jgi:RimJ/RimL family protein N-acetyltransferase